MESIPENRYLKFPPGILQNIRKIYNLDKTERLEEAIKILEQWILKQDHIVKKDFGKAYLERTLISCKGSVEKSKKQIDTLCTMRTLLPKFFSKINVKEELAQILQIAMVIPLPLVIDDYYRVLVVKCNNKYFTTESFMQFYQYLIITLEYIKAHDYVNGFIGIYDFRDVNLFDVITKLNSVELQQYLSILIKGYGARILAIHMLTESKLVDMLVKTLRQLLSEKIGNRVHVQPTLEDLHKVVPKEALPVEFGGNERSVEILHAEFVEELSSEKHLEYVKMMHAACSDETKRHEGKFNEEYMGMPGSFRCLSVD
ncbi:hypothetical protein PYW08_008018 [Mythimna loreyi]|uniref:Uncharacterized protein n=1 Tax=Mythimna loreyi TaxID=667449 RepID=A0ACC2QA42_9NEOP|nr:hypothetical protein PYW08_008018 [Mythimna loreyi]